MKTTLRLLAVGVLTAALLAATGCNKLRARDQLNKGVQAYKSARFEQAIEHFKNAVALDPNLSVAKLYLATAYTGQYIPGVDSEENIRMAEQAIDQYKEVLATNPDSTYKLTCLKGIASLYFNMKKLDQARDYYRQALGVDPNDPEIYYSIGVIDWTETYQKSAAAKAPLGLKVDDEYKKDKESAKVCQDLKDANGQKVTEGLDVLQKAVDLRPDYDDAMAYLNLLYRRRADIQCGDPEARAADLKTADEWVAKTMAVKRAKAEKAAQPGGIHLEQPQR
jgi:tetratricopeptide (TPR) repeat protein